MAPPRPRRSSTTSLPPKPRTVETRAAEAERRRNSWWFEPDATTITELDPDGLPVGMAADDTRYFRAVPGLPMRQVLFGLWVVVAALSFYGARDLQSAVVHDEGLSQRAWLLSLVNGLTRASELLGPAKLRDLIDAGLAPIKQKAPALEDGGASVVEAGQVEPEQGAIPTAAQVGNGTERNRILIVGASSIQFYMGAELERRLEQYQSTVTHRFGKLGTGLARPDTFDWLTHLPKLLENFKPTVVIAQFGGNDGQPLEVEGGKVLAFGTDEWKTEYARRVRKVIDLAAAAKAKTIMLGMQITRLPKHSAKLKVVNEVTQKTAEAAGAIYVDTWELAADEEGNSRATIVYGGKSGQMYLGDGVHYGRLGATFVAEKLSWRLERLLPLVPKDRALARAMVMDVESVVLADTSHYLAFVPQPGDNPSERFPVLYLLHGADGSWTDFSDRAHATLQAFAGANRIIVVTPDGTPNGWYLDSSKVPGASVETYFMKELLPDVDARLPTAKRRSVIGLSMGGNGAIVLGLKYPGIFEAVSSMSGAVDLSKADKRPALIARLGPYAENKAAWEEHSAIHMVRARKPQAMALPLYLTVGSEDVWAPPNRALHAVLDELQVPHEFKESPGGHAWSHWLEVLPGHLDWQAKRLKSR